MVAYGKLLKLTEDPYDELCATFLDSFPVQICTCSPKRRNMSQEMCIDIILIPTTKGKTHLISQRLSLNMSRLNQNQRIQALTMLTRGDVSNISRAFGCHRNTSVSSKQVGWQIAVDPIDQGLQTLEWTGSLR